MKHQKIAFCQGILGPNLVLKRNIWLKPKRFFLKAIKINVSLQRKKHPQIQKTLEKNMWSYDSPLSGEVSPTARKGGFGQSSPLRIGPTCGHTNLRPHLFTIPPGGKGIQTASCWSKSWCRCFNTSVDAWRLQEKSWIIAEKNYPRANSQIRISSKDTCSKRFV